MAATRLFIQNTEEFFQGLVTLLQQCGLCCQENWDGGYPENQDLRPLKLRLSSCLPLRVNIFFCGQISRIFPDLFFIFQTQGNSEILHGPRRNNCLNYENNELKKIQFHLFGF